MTIYDRLIGREYDIYHIKSYSIEAGTLYIRRGNSAWNYQLKDVLENLIKTEDPVLYKILQQEFPEEFI